MACAQHAIHYVKHAQMAIQNAQAAMMDLLITQPHLLALQNVLYQINFTTHSHIRAQTVLLHVKLAMVPDMINASLATIRFH